MTTATDPQQDSAAATTSPHAVLFELEGIAGSIRAATFEALKSILSEHDIKLQPAHISRFCLRPTPEMYVEELLEAVGASRLSADKLVDDVRSGIALHLSSQTKKLAGPMAALIDEAHKYGIQLAALSGLPSATATALTESLGLNERGVQVTVIEEQDAHFPRADSWLKLAKSLGKNPFNCGVIATSRAATKSSLSAGMHCVAIPDSYTSHEDFSGADVIIDDLAEMNVEEVMTRLCPHYQD